MGRRFAGPTLGADVNRTLAVKLPEARTPNINTRHTTIPLNSSVITTTTSSNHPRPSHSTFPSAQTPSLISLLKMTTSTPSLSLDVSNGYAWIADHLMTSPSTYQMPLRAMWELNAPGGELSTRHQRHHPGSTPGTPSSRSGSGISHEGISSYEEEDASARSSSSATSFTPSTLSSLRDPRDTLATLHANVMQHFTTTTTTSPGANMPLTTITNFVREALPGELRQVRFSEGLTCLDFLREIETKRRREWAGVRIRLGVPPDQGGRASYTERVEDGSPVDAWIQAMTEKEQDAESLYSQVYVGVRHWVS